MSGGKGGGGKGASGGRRGGFLHFHPCAQLRVQSLGQELMLKEVWSEMVIKDVTEGAHGFMANVQITSGRVVSYLLLRLLCTLVVVVALCSRYFRFVVS